MCIGVIGGTQAALSLGFSGIVGRFLDAGHHRYVLLVGGLLVTFGYLGLGVLPTGERATAEGLDYASVLALQGVMAGTGLCCIFMCCSQCGPQVSTFFITRSQP